MIKIVKAGRAGHIPIFFRLKDDGIHIERSVPFLIGVTCTKQVIKKGGHQYKNRKRYANAKEADECKELSSFEHRDGYFKIIFQHLI